MINVLYSVERGSELEYKCMKTQGSKDVPLWYCEETPGEHTNPLRNAQEIHRERKQMQGDFEEVHEGTHINSAI